MQITLNISPSDMQKVREYVGRARAPGPDDPPGPLPDEDMIAWIKEELIGHLRRDIKEKEWIATKGQLKANIPEIDIT